MAVEVEKLIRRMEHTLGGPFSGSIDPMDLINQAGQFCVTLHPWVWLMRQTTTLDLVAHVPYVRLPLNFPGDIRDIIAYDATDSLVNSLTFTTWDQILELRTYQIQDVSFHYWAVVSHLPKQLPNLLLETEKFNAPEWPALNVTVTANDAGALDPITGEQTTYKLDTTIAAGRINQVVAAHRLVESKYAGTIYVKGGTAVETAISIETNSNTDRTRIKIVWATFTVTLDQGIGAGVHTFIVTRLHNGWLRIQVDMTRVAINDNGTLIFRIYPAGLTLLGTCFVARAQVEALEVFSNATTAPLAATEYQAVVGTVPPVGGKPEPVLSLWPIPQTSESGKLSIVYRAGWPEIDDDQDVVAIPDYLDTWFIEACMMWARGLEEEDDASLSERATKLLIGGRDEFGLPGNVLLRAAMERDLDLQTDAGPLRGGAVSTGAAWMDWGINTSVSGPDAS